MIKKTEHEIRERWEPGADTMVSFCCLAYNHERFISKTLDGFLCQDTDFPFEIVVGEDCSTDGTRAILEDYREKYPNLIRLLTSETNVGAKENYYRTHRACLSPYIAYCEGDDFWTDPNKIALQIKFLLTHPEYVASGHDTTVVDEEGREVYPSNLKAIFGNRFKADEDDALEIPTLSRVYRNNIIDFPPEAKNTISQDTFHLAVLKSIGRIKFHPEITGACYRLHGGGVWSGLNLEEKAYNNLNTLFWLFRYFRRINNIHTANKYWRAYCLNVLKACLKRVALLQKMHIYRRRLGF